MTKKDIEKGDLVLLRDGRICVAMNDTDDPNKGLTLYGKINSPFGFLDPISKISIGKVIHLDTYDDDLTDSYRPLSGYDIMAVRKSSNNFVRFSVPFIFYALFYISEEYVNIIWDWKREEVKEVTMAEVEEKFGCSVKIIKEEDNE